MLPGLSRNLNPMGIFIVSNGGAWGLVALNSNPLGNTTLSAVIAKNEPFTSRLEEGPKIIPLGLMKNRLALPKTPSFPKIFETLLPVTRLRIF